MQCGPSAGPLKNSVNLLNKLKRAPPESSDQPRGVEPFTRFECQMYACAVYNEGLRFPDRLLKYVSRFGPLADVKISRNGRGINYALVTFANPFARERALSAVHPWPLVIRQYGKRADEGLPRARATNTRKERPHTRNKEELDTKKEVRKTV